MREQYLTADLKWILDVLFEGPLDFEFGGKYFSGEKKERSNKKCSDMKSRVLKFLVRPGGGVMLNLGDWLKYLRFAKIRKFNF